jgi:hypothetical protein
MWQCLYSRAPARFGHWTATYNFRVLQVVSIKAMILAAGASEDATGDREVFGAVGFAAQAIPDVQDSALARNPVFIRSVCITDCHRPSSKICSCSCRYCYSHKLWPDSVPPCCYIIP